MNLDNEELTRGAIPPAVDADEERRPGVPMELDPPQVVGGAHWGIVPAQPDPGNVLKRASLERLTPVFGTSVPPHGLSGAMRRAAYRIPEHYTSHWLALLLADRVDAVEHGGDVRPIALMATMATVACAGAVALVLFWKGRRGWS